MCVKLPPEYLNHGPYLPHPTNTYTCEATITPRVCGGNLIGFLSWLWFYICVCVINSLVMQMVSFGVSDEISMI